MLDLGHPGDALEASLDPAAETAQRNCHGRPSSPAAARGARVSASSADDRRTPTPGAPPGGTR